MRYDLKKYKGFSIRYEDGRDRGICIEDGQDCALILQCRDRFPSVEDAEKYIDDEISRLEKPTNKVKLISIESNYFKTEISNYTATSVYKENSSYNPKLKIRAKNDDSKYGYGGCDFDALFLASQSTAELQSIMQEMTAVKMKLHNWKEQNKLSPRKLMTEMGYQTEYINKLCEEYEPKTEGE